MSKKERRDSDRWSDRRDSQPEDEQQRRSGETEIQESDSLAALKAILSKVAALLKPLQLTQDESIRLVEQLYGSVLDMDVKLAGEADDTRKSHVLSHIQNTTITRGGDRIVVEFPSGKEREAEAPAEAPTVGAAPAGAGPAVVEPAVVEPAVVEPAAPSVSATTAPVASEPAPAEAPPAGE